MRSALRAPSAAASAADAPSARTGAGASKPTSGPKASGLERAAAQSHDAAKHAAAWLSGTPNAALRTPKPLRVETNHARGVLAYYADYEQARNAALCWLLERRFVADTSVTARLGPHKGMAIGMRDGSTGFRVEWDPHVGAHINVFSGKEKGPHFLFPASRETALRIAQRFDRRFA